MSDSETHDQDGDPRQTRRDDAKVWRAPRLQIAPIATATAAKGQSSSEVSPIIGPS